MPLPRSLLPILCLLWPLASWGALAGPEAAGLDFFEKKIRPVLVEKCYKCHSADAEKLKGGLSLDTRDGIRRGGDNGPAVVPGKLEDSLLIEAIRYHQKDTAMPPEKAGGKLPEAVIQDFEKWVQMGAPDSREGAGKVTRQQESYEEAKKWWAWQPPQKSPAPALKGSTWPKTEIDRFLLAGLNEKGLKPVADADKPTLLRRVYFDLIGLPPAPEALDAFLSDTSPNAFAKVVDRLLASSQYGERWGRHWLDVARFAESSGKDVNIAFPHAWRYRDYVIAAFNEDKPYDAFIREQIAGDLLPAKDEKTRAEHTVATGFLAIGPKGLNEKDPRQFALDLADEQLDTMAQAFLGVTVGCARCHDHKFDPIPQRDYYALAGIFLSTQTEYGTAGGIQNLRPSELIELPAAAAPPTIAKTLPPAEREQKEKRLADLRKEGQELLGEQMSAVRAQKSSSEPLAPPNLDRQKQVRALFLRTAIGLLEADLKSFDAAGHPKPLAMGARDLPVTPPAPASFGRGATMAEKLRTRFREKYGRAPEFKAIADSALYTRGDADKPGERVPRGFVTVLTKGPAPAIPAGSSGRLQLAQWLTAPENPTTARVMVNRVWHWLFGEGIVPTPDNFGTTGEKPSNQALLDTLAVEFREGGWSVKKLVREIVLSHAYQLASTYEEHNFTADPGNVLHWRMNKRRLDAECIRDAVLAASGQLETAAPVGDAIALAGEGPVGIVRVYGTPEAAIVDAGARTNVRSLYLPIARDILPDALSVFDFPEPSLVTGSRETTNVPAQALFMLNSPFVGKSAQKVADRINAVAPKASELEQRVTMAYRLIFSRAPTAAEIQAAATYFRHAPQPAAGDGPPAVSLGTPSANLTTYCRALLASAEFRYVD